MAKSCHEEMLYDQAVAHCAPLLNELLVELAEHSRKPFKQQSHDSQQKQSLENRVLMALQRHGSHLPQIGGIDPAIDFSHPWLP